MDQPVTGAPVLVEIFVGEPCLDRGAARRPLGGDDRVPQATSSRASGSRDTERPSNGMRSGKGQGGGGKPGADGLAVTPADHHSNFMSRHFEMSEPRPDEMVMQPRTFSALLSLAQTA